MYTICFLLFFCYSVASSDTNSTIVPTQVISVVASTVPPSHNASLLASILFTGLANTTVTGNTTVSKSLNGTPPIVGETKNTESGFHLTDIFGPGIAIIPAVGDKCLVNSDCKIDNSFCTNGTCQCFSGFISSRSNRRCLKIARKMQEECDEDAQCEVGLSSSHGLVSCITFICACRLGTTDIGGRCVGRSVLGETCRKNLDCKVPLSSCQQEVCACPAGMEPSPEDDKCLEAKVNNSSKTYSSFCTFDSMCNHLGEHARCYNMTCICKPDYHLGPDFCIRDRRLGEYCTVSSDCIVPELVVRDGPRTCRNSQCSCIEGYKITKEGFCRSGSTQMKPTLIGAVILFLIVLFNNNKQY